jgi:N5-(cytidine 5'-diphosphoramidyl)-L-glutamine hydrolase
MKKKLGLTQRVTRIDDYHERRDSLDQRWWPLVHALNCIPIPLPNLPATEVAHYLEILDLSAIIITGGNSLQTADPNAADTAPERDAFELALIPWAIQKQLPIVGVCRGMQIINHYFGGTLVPVTGHVATPHRIQFCHDWKHLHPRTVNSYHQWGIYAENLAKNLRITAQHADQSIEAFVHTQEKIAGMMWHPERDSVFADIELMRDLLL